MYVLHLFMIPICLMTCMLCRQHSRDGSEGDAQWMPVELTEEETLQVYKICSHDNTLSSCDAMHYTALSSCDAMQCNAQHLQAVMRCNAQHMQAVQFSAPCRLLHHLALLLPSILPLSFLFINVDFLLFLCLFLFLFLFLSSRC